MSLRSDVQSTSGGLEALLVVQTTSLPGQALDDLLLKLILAAGIQVEYIIPDATVVNRTDYPVNEICYDKQGENLRLSFPGCVGLLSQLVQNGKELRWLANKQPVVRQSLYCSHSRPLGIGGANNRDGWKLTT